MQSKENLRTGSMSMTLDSEREVKIENRETDGRVWVMYLPQQGVKWRHGQTLRAGTKRIAPYTYVKLDANELGGLRLECNVNRCTLSPLPPGMSPKDITVQGR